MSMVEFTGQTYGEATRQRQSQRMVPAGPSPTGEVELGAFNRPTEAPEEPVTSGVPMGAGPGPEAIPAIGIQPGSREDIVIRLRAIASKYPNPALLQLLAVLGGRDGVA